MPLSWNHQLVILLCRHNEIIKQNVVFSYYCHVSMHRWRLDNRSSWFKLMSCLIIIIDQSIRLYSIKVQHRQKLHSVLQLDNIIICGEDFIFTGWGRVMGAGHLSSLATIKLLMTWSWRLKSGATILISPQLSSDPLKTIFLEVNYLFILRNLPFVISRKQKNEFVISR